MAPSLPRPQPTASARTWCRLSRIPSAVYLHPQRIQHHGTAREELGRYRPRYYPDCRQLYEYDAMGNAVKQTLALAEQPSPANSPITETSFGAESLENGVYSITTTTRYNAAGQPLISVQKQLISQLSPTLESKSVFVSERGFTSTQWSEYSAEKKFQYNLFLGQMEILFQ